MRILFPVVALLLLQAPAAGCSGPSSEGTSSGSDSAADVPAEVAADLGSADVHADQIRPLADVSPESTTDAAPVDVSDTAAPVDGPDAAAPVDVSDTAAPVDVSDTAAPDDVSDAAAPDGVSDAAAPDGVSDTAIPDTALSDAVSEASSDTPDETCLPSCDGKECGDDGCGGSCGTCQGAQELCIDGTCLCLPLCEGMDCGEDGCGGKCGSCEAHFVCEEGLCIYQPWCGDGTCDTELVEDCSTCPGDCPCGCGEACSEGTCTFAGCDGKVCGDDGCGGSCGTCPAPQSQCVGGKCACPENTWWCATENLCLPTGTCCADEDCAAPKLCASPGAACSCPQGPACPQPGGTQCSAGIEYTCAQVGECLQWTSAGACSFGCGKLRCLRRLTLKNPVKVQCGDWDPFPYKLPDVYVEVSGKKTNTVYDTCGIISFAGDLALATFDPGDPAPTVNVWDEDLDADDLICSDVADTTTGVHTLTTLDCEVGYLIEQ